MTAAERARSSGFYPLVPRPCSSNACRLPEDCERCERFTCAGCMRQVPWSEGAADDCPDLCDSCATDVAAIDWSLS
jgi:hypothetical protein